MFSVDIPKPTRSIFGHQDSERILGAVEAPAGWVARNASFLLASFGCYDSFSLFKTEDDPSTTPLSTRREAGGITQEIRARTVSLEQEIPERGHGNPKGRDEAAEAAGASEDARLSSSQKLAPTVATFLDTPGQEIFYRMRTNGARVADAIVLVVSGMKRYLVKY